MLSADTLHHLAASELTQLAEEGCDTAALAALFEQAASLPPVPKRAAFETWWQLAAEATPSADFAYDEPSDLAGIQAARPDGPRRMAAVSEAALSDRIRGAWLGRTAGCMLGKPVEGWSKPAIEGLLRHAGAYPLSNYFPPVTDAPEGLQCYPPQSDCLLGNIRYGARDDDTDYTVIGLHALERFGPEFTPRDMATIWLDCMPYHRVYTAEREAYRNFVDEVWPPASATLMNPFREWIGAQIRCDGFAYCAATWPEKAAEFAWRDASISHTKNGIYGEMFFAALIAACMATDDLHEAIAIARAEIPERCRLTEAIDDTVAWCADDADWQTTWDRMDAKYGHYHPVHTINNAVVVLIGCLHAKGDFEKAVCVAVMGGLDTDCNGATAGSVMGALLGAAGVPDRWTRPLNDTLHSAVAGFEVNRISDLAERTLVQAKRVLGG